MITFYVTSRFWESSSSDLLDYKSMTESDIANFCSKNPNELVKIEPTPVECVFRDKFISENLDEHGFIKEGIYQTRINGIVFDFRLLENINVIYSRKRRRVSSPPSETI